MVDTQPENNKPPQSGTSRKAAKAARQKRTIAHWSKRTRTALGKEGPRLPEETKPLKIKRSAVQGR
jgi:hypothetical protein